MSASSAAGLAALSGSLLVLSTAAITLRFYARYKQELSFQIDDWLVIPAWLVLLGIIAEAFYGIQQRFAGYPEPANKSIAEAQHPEMLKAYFALDVISVFALSFIKLSALFFYRRIFCCGSRNRFHFVTIIAIVVVVLWNVVYFILPFCVCTPADALSHNSSCNAEYGWLESVAMTGFILDLVIICIPLPKIWSLNLRTSKKIALCGVFLLALAGFGASTARLALVIMIVKAGSAKNHQDLYKVNSRWLYFTLLEVGMTLIAVNLPSLWYFTQGVEPARILRSVRSKLSTRSSSNSHGSINTDCKYHQSAEMGTKNTLEVVHSSDAFYS